MNLDLTLPRSKRDFPSMTEERKKRVIETTFRVRFAETDQMGIVHHSAYVVWLEEGRSEWGRQAGMPYSAFNKTGYALAVTELSLRYMAPARYDDLVMVRTWVGELASRGITYEFEVVNPQSGQKHVTASTRLICIDATGRVRRIPQAWFEKWQTLVYE
jgi:acyl-CoA thioester hydrolase